MEVKVLSREEIKDLARECGREDRKVVGGSFVDGIYKTGGVTKKHFAGLKIKQSDAKRRLFEHNTELFLAVDQISLGFVVFFDHHIDCVCKSSDFVAADGGYFVDPSIPVSGCQGQAGDFIGDLGERFSDISDQQVINQ